MKILCSNFFKQTRNIFKIFTKSFLASHVSLINWYSLTSMWASFFIECLFICLHVHGKQIGKNQQVYSHRTHRYSVKIKTSFFSNQSVILKQIFFIQSFAYRVQICKLMKNQIIIFWGGIKIRILSLHLFHYVSFPFHKLQNILINFN